MKDSMANMSFYGTNNKKKINHVKELKRLKPAIKNFRGNYFAPEFVVVVFFEKSLYKLTAVRC